MLLRLNEKICANYVTNFLEDNKSLINISLYCHYYCQYNLYRKGSMQSNAVVEIVMDYKSSSLDSKPFLLTKNLNESKSENHSVLSNSLQPMDCSLPGSSVPGILQVRIRRGQPFRSPGHFPNPGIEPRSPSLQHFFELKLKFLFLVLFLSCVILFCFPAPPIYFLLHCFVLPMLQRSRLMSLSLIVSLSPNYSLKKQL